MKKVKGLTLIELIITVAIIAILAAVFLQLNERYTRRVTRTDAVRGLNIAANDMEKCAAARGGSYTGCVAFTSREIQAGTTPNGKYNLAIVPLGGGTGFLITATRIAGVDLECQAGPNNYRLVINNLGQQGIQNGANPPEFEQGNTPQMITQIRACWNK